MSFNYKKSKIITCTVCVAILLSLSFTYIKSCYAKDDNFFSKCCYTLPAGKDILLWENYRTQNNIKWFVSDSTVATIDSNGIAHGIKKGRATVSAFKEDDNKTFSCTLEISDEEPVRGVYSSQNVGDVNSLIKIYAITPRCAGGLKLEIRGNDYSKDMCSESKSEKGEVYIWEFQHKFPKCGEYHVKAYSKVNNQWKTGCNSECIVLVSNNLEKYKTSLTEKRVSDKCVEFIASCEGFYSTVYKDIVNIFSIGYGKRIWPYEPFYNNLTQEEGLAMFCKTLNQGNCSKAINHFLINNSIKFNQQQFDALVSFTYNIGASWVQKPSDLSSILLRSSKNLKKSFYGIVNSDNGIYLRTSPGMKGKKLKALPNNTKVDVLSPDKENNNWYHVKVGGLTGYCYGDYLKVYSVVEGTDGKDLNLINKDEFIKEFSLYHHAGKKCCRGLLSRRYHELDIFLYDKYSRFRTEHFSYGNYPVPPCVNKNKNV